MPSLSSSQLTSPEQPGPTQATSSRLPKTNPLAKKLESILTVHLDFTQPSPRVDAFSPRVSRQTPITETLAHLSQFYKENTAENRKKLGSDLEWKRIQRYQKIYDILQPVNNEVDKLHAEMQSIKSCADDLESKLATMKLQNSRLLSESTRLKNLREDLEAKSSITEAFLAKFTLSEKETEILKTVDDQVTQDFFDALSRLTQAQQDCKILLMADNNKAGLDVMASVQQLQESAFDRLFHWTQQMTSSLNRESPEITPVMRRAVHALKHRHVLLQTIVDDITIVRRNALTRSFQEGLSSMGLHAYDSQRYIGDMLAWLHQAACSERELLEQLLYDDEEFERKRLGSRKGSQVADSVLVLSPTLAPDMDEIITRILDRVFEGICRPLRVRVDQVLPNLQTAGASYKIANMIQFYARMLARVICSGTETAEDPSRKPQIIGYLDDITQSAYKLFYEMLNAQASELMRFDETPVDESTPPEVMRSTIAELKDLMSDYESSLVLPLSPARDRVTTNFEQASTREDGFEPILAAVVDPLIQLSQRCAKKLDASKQPSFLLNCYSLILSSLRLYSVLTQSRFEQLEEQIKLQKDAMKQ